MNCWQQIVKENFLPNNGAFNRIKTSGLKEDSDAEETRELTVNSANKRKEIFRFFRVFLYLLTII